MARPIIADVRTTPEIEFMKGTFQLSSWKIPYLSVIMNLEDAGNHLNLTADLPGSESINWQIDELFQRDIDWRRVKHEIVPYLLHTDEPQFFNSITIALLPYYKEELKTNFTNTIDWTPPTLKESNRFDSITAIGPISIGYWNANQQAGVLMWNTDQLYGVAIDGQHRLAAIKEYCDNPGSRQNLRSTSIPVTLLLFDEDFGFSAPVATSNIDLLRILFIDLNKHSQTVNRARQILLDDRDPHSVCVRKLVANELSSDLSTLEANNPSLPLSLVDWHTEQAKFDNGPFLATILGLDGMVGRILGSKPIKDFTDYQMIKKQIDGINKNLEISMEDASKRITQRITGVDLTPFAYTTIELDKIAEAFAASWTPSLCNLLTKFTPYRDFINLRLDTNSFSLDFQHWYELYHKAESDRRGDTRATRDYQQLLKRLQHRSYNPLHLSQFLDVIERLDEHKTDNLAFNVAFQRAFIDAFLEYKKIDSDHISELLPYEDDELEDIDFEDYNFDAYEEPSQPIYMATETIEKEIVGDLAQRVVDRSNEFVYALNLLLNNWPAFLDSKCAFEIEEDGNTREAHLWQGTLLKPEGTIDFTQGASNRAKDLLFLVAATYTYDDQTDPEPGSDFDRFWSRCHSANAPALCKRAKRAIDRFSGDRRGTAASRILLARDGQFDAQKARDEIYFRLRKFWIELNL